MGITIPDLGGDLAGDRDPQKIRDLKIEKKKIIPKLKNFLFPKDPFFEWFLQQKFCSPEKGKKVTHGFQNEYALETRFDRIYL